MKNKPSTIALALTCLCVGMALSPAAARAGNGIQALVQVALQKAQSAEDSANDSAKKQRAAIKKEKDARARKRLTELASQNERHAAAYGDLEQRLNKIQVQLAKSKCK